MSPEETYLGQLLLHNDYFYQFPVNRMDFVSERCRGVYDFIAEMLEQRQPVDLVIVAKATEFDATWVMSLTNDFTVGIEKLAQIVTENGRRHRLSVLLRSLVETVDSTTADGTIEQIEKGIAELSESVASDGVKIGSGVSQMVAEFERRFKAHGDIPGIRSGLTDLDDLTLGFEPSRYIVVGARPSEGKSALLLHFAISAAKTGLPVGFISIESSRGEMTERAFASVGGIPLDTLKTGTFGHSHMKSITDAAGIIQQLPIVIADRPNMSIDQVKAHARVMVRKYGVKMLCVDYVQLIQAGAGLSDYERVSHVSVSLKQLSRELEIPVIAAAQLNRNSDEGRQRQPRLSDFKNSGQIEQDADIAILIDRDKDDNLWLRVAKNRDGATGRVQVWFDGSRMRFAGHSPIAE